MAGTLIFGVTFSIGMFVGQNWVGQRFSGSLKLLITMPVSKAFLHSRIVAVLDYLKRHRDPLLFGFGVLAGVPVSPTWPLLPILGLPVLTVAGLTLFHGAKIDLRLRSAAHAGAVPVADSAPDLIR